MVNPSVKWAKVASTALWSRTHSNHSFARWLILVWNTFASMCHGNWYDNCLCCGCVPGWMGSTWCLVKWRRAWRWSPSWSPTACTMEGPPRKLLSQTAESLSNLIAIQVIAISRGRGFIRQDLQWLKQYGLVLGDRVTLIYCFCHNFVLMENCRKWESE